MSEESRAIVARCRAAGERLAVATALDGGHAGAQLLVWPAGHTFGDLGWPRLNQRVALYAEQLLERQAQAASSKRFEVPGAARVEIRIEIVGSGRDATG